jgi:hypothetical protein
VKVGSKQELLLSLQEAFFRRDAPGVRDGRRRIGGWLSVKDAARADQLLREADELFRQKAKEDAAMSEPLPWREEAALEF